MCREYIWVGWETPFHPGENPGLFVMDLAEFQSTQFETLHNSNQTNLKRPAGFKELLCLKESAGIITDSNQAGVTVWPSRRLVISKTQPVLLELAFLFHTAAEHHEERDAGDEL